MRLSLKTRILNVFRAAFKVPTLERALADMTANGSPRSLVAKLVPNPYQYAKPSWRKINKDGIILHVDISDYLGHYYYFGFVDTSHDALEQLCLPGMVVLDVGTNLGYTALRLAKKVADGSVVGFEPDPQNFTLCQKNLAANNFRNLQVHNVGLGASRKTAIMETRVSFNRGGNRINENVADGQRIEVHMLDEYFPSLGVPRVDLMKIDVEGYELQVLRGAERIISEYRPRLFVEVDDSNLKDQGDSAELLIEFLRKLGYKISDAETGIAVESGRDLINKHIDIIAVP
ncbi:MAG TPA: FkbM family methyltransferase [Ohtaekwangia sp.]|nr:FkbM family methyltransferase [Ohtaekwangia sp.]